MTPNPDSDPAAGPLPEGVDGPQDASGSLYVIIFSLP